MQFDTHKRQRSATQSSASASESKSKTPKHVSKVRKVTDAEIDELLGIFNNATKFVTTSPKKASAPSPSDILAEALGKTKIHGRTYLPKALRTLGEALPVIKEKDQTTNKPKKKTKAELIGYTKRRVPKQKVTRTEKIAAIEDVDDLANILTNMNDLGKKARPVAKAKRTQTPRVKKETDPIGRVQKVLQRIVPKDDGDCVLKIWSRKRRVHDWITVFRNLIQVLNLYAFTIATMYVDGDINKIKKDPNGPYVLKYLKENAEDFGWLYRQAIIIQEQINIAKERIPTYRDRSGDKAWDEENIQLALDCFHAFEISHLQYYMNELYPILDVVLSKVPGVNASGMETAMEV